MGAGHDSLGFHDPNLTQVRFWIRGKPKKRMAPRTRLELETFDSERNALSQATVLACVGHQ